MRSRVLIGALTLLLLGTLATSSPHAFAVATPGLSCGAAPVYDADGTRWTCSFDDEFADGLDSTKWVAQANMGSGDPSVAYACFEKGNVAVSGGALHLTVRREAAPVACWGQTNQTYYTAGQVSTYHLFSQQYGRFEARMRTAATVAPGLHEAFWLWPNDRTTTLNWPTTGEIDVAETYSNYSSALEPFLHYTGNDNGGPVRGRNTSYCLAQRGVWNTYDLVWTPTSITVSTNGQICLVNASGNPAFNERYIVALSGTLGFGNDALTARTPMPATTDVDYVRVWQQ